MATVWGKFCKNGLLFIPPSGDIGTLNPQTRDELTKLPFVETSLRGNVARRKHVRPELIK